MPKAQNPKLATIRPFGFLVSGIHSDFGFLVSGFTRPPAFHNRTQFPAAAARSRRPSSHATSNNIGPPPTEKYAVNPSASDRSAPSPTAPTSATHGTPSARHIRLN